MKPDNNRVLAKKQTVGMNVNIDIYKTPVVVHLYVYT